MSEQNAARRDQQADRRRRSSGQTLAIFAAGLPILLGMVGLGVDAGNAYAQNLGMQSAADLAALSGTNSLPEHPTVSDYTAARNRAIEVAQANYDGAITVTAVAPYDGGKYKVEVKISGSVSTFLGPFVGISSFDVEVSSVADSSWSASGGSMPAIFAGCSSVGGTSCSEPSKAILWGGSDNNVIGGVHTNCGMEVSGSNNSVTGSTTLGCSSSPSGSGSGNTYSASPTSSARLPYPEPVRNYTFDTFCAPGAPDVVVRRTSGKLELKNYYLSGSTLRPGVYCSSGSSAEIVSGDGHVIGHNVTLVTTGKIEFSGSNFNLKAFHSTKVLMWANGTGPSVIKFNGSDGTWNGIIFAPRGEVEFSGSNNSTVGGGSVIADKVKLNGSLLTIDSNGLSSLGPATRATLQLIE